MHKQHECEAMGTWPLDDEVIGLRVFGTDEIHELSTRPRVQLIGSSSRCDVVLRNHHGNVAPQHAKLMRHGSRWLIRAMADTTTDGLWRDRIELHEFPIVPGIHFRIGEVTLIAESARSRALHRLLSRLLGF